MRNVSVAGQFSRRPRLIGSFFGGFGDPGEAGQRWQPPVPFEQSTGSRDRTPASGGVRFVPRRPAPSTGTGLGASASLSPSAPSAGASRSQRPGNRVATNGPRLLQPARRRLTGKVNMATTERGILEGKVLPELQAIASSMGVQGFQRLRKADLIGAIIAKAQGVEFVPSSTPARGRGGGPAPPPATLTEPSSNGEVAQAAEAPPAPAAEQPAQAPAAEAGSGQAAEAGSPPATRTEGAQGEQQAQGGGQSQGDQQQGGGDRGQRRDRDRDWGGQGGGGNRWDNQQGQGGGRRGGPRLPQPPAGRRPARGQPHRHPRHPLPGRLRLPAGQQLPAGARGRVRAPVDDPPDGPAPRRRDRGHGQAAPRLREVRRPLPGRQSQRPRSRGGAQPPRLQGPDAAVPAGAAAPGAQPDRDLDPDHGPDVPHREGPAGHDRLPAQGGQDHADEADRQRHQREQPRGVPRSEEH